MRTKRLTSVIAVVAGLALGATVVVAAGGAAAGTREALAVPTTMSYQGHLLDSSGDPVDDGAYAMTFSLWDNPTVGSGTQLWGPEAHPSVDVTDGFFAVILGETSPIAPSVLGSSAYIQIEVGGETLEPRQKLAAVAFALSASQAETVPWSGVTGKPSTFTPSGHTHDWSDVTGKSSTFTPSSHTHDERYYTEAESDARYLAADEGIPTEVILMWSGSVGSIPDGWALCDGTNGTPDLRDRFIVGAGGSYSVADTGGEISHTLTITEVPAHEHSVNPPSTYTDYQQPDVLIYEDGSGPNQGRWNLDWEAVGVYGSQSAWPNTLGAGYQNFMRVQSHRHAVDIAAFDSGSAGSGQAHENRPPYYALAFIMKVD